MNDAVLDELLGAFALDALNPVEHEQVADYLARSPRARDEVEQHRAVAALLAHSGDDAPMGVWHQIVAQLDGDVMPSVRMPAAALPPLLLERPDPAPVDPAPADTATPVASLKPSPQDHRGEVVPIGPAGPKRRRLATAVAAAAASCALLGAGVGLGSLVVGDGEQLASDGPNSSVMLMPSDPAADQDGAVGVEVDSEGVATLDGRSLPELPEGTCYQLWAQAEGELISVAVFTGEADLWQFPLMDGFDALHLTHESSEHGVVSSQEAPIFSSAAA